MNSMDEIKNCIQEFNDLYPRPGMGKIEINEIYDLKTHWNKSYESWMKSGVYFLLDENHLLLYVGVSVNIGGRWQSYVKYADDGVGYTIVDSRFPNLRYLLAIFLPEGHEFESGAIEYYFIGKLNPPVNVHGKKSS